MSIRNFSKLFQKMVINKPIQMPRYTPFRNITSVKDTTGSKISESNFAAEDISQGEQKQQLDQQSNSGKIDTEQNKNTENVEFKKDSQTQGQRDDQNKPHRFEESSNKSFERNQEQPKMQGRSEDNSKNTSYVYKNNEQLNAEVQRDIVKPGNDHRVH